MAISVTDATADDLRDIRQLVLQLAIFELQPDAVIASEEDYKTDFENGVFSGFCARNEDGLLVGMMVFYMSFSTWKGRQLYLEDFYILESHRSQGIGQLLFAKLRQKAKEWDVRRIKFEVLDWNEPAIKFYKAQKCRLEAEWTNCFIDCVDGNNL